MLVRSITLPQFFSISFGAAVGVGWITLMGDWLMTAGSIGTALSFLVGGLAVGWVALGYIELATAIPKPGGEMIYAFEVLGPLAGFVVGWFLAAANVAISAFETISIGWVAAAIAPIPDGPVLYGVLGEDVYAVRMAMGVVFLIGMGWLNYRGAVFAAFAQSLFMAFFFAAAALFVVAGLFRGDVANLQPLFSGSSFKANVVGVVAMLAIAPTFIMGFNYALQGIAERAPNVSLKSLSKVLLLSIASIAIFYALVVVAASMSVPREVILAAKLPVAEAFRATLGNGFLGQMVLIAGLFGLLTTWNAVLFAGTRIVFELSEKGLLPPVFSRIHPKHGSPYIAAIFVTAASSPGVLLSSAALSPIISAASMCYMGALFATCIALLVRRRNTKAPASAFRVPGGKAGMGIVMLIGGILLFMSVFGAYFSNPTWHIPVHWIVIAVWGAVGAVLYYFEQSKLKPRKA